jgi:hypothetical protein
MGTQLPGASTTEPSNPYAGNVGVIAISEKTADTNAPKWMHRWKLTGKREMSGGWS